MPLYEMVAHLINFGIGMTCPSHSKAYPWAWTIPKIHAKAIVYLAMYYDIR